jgi:hypothetical protein
MDINTRAALLVDTHCPSCLNPVNPWADGSCHICGYWLTERECPHCENVLDAGEECGCHDEEHFYDCFNCGALCDRRKGHACDHERERHDDDGRTYADPRDERERLIHGD